MSVSRSLPSGVSYLDWEAMHALFCSLRRHRQVSSLTVSSLEQVVQLARLQIECAAVPSNDEAV